MEKINLGDTVKDIHTGFVGTAMTRTEFFNGCIQFDVMPKIKKGENKPQDGISIDEQSLVVVKKFKKKEEKEEDYNGGPYRKQKKMRGY
jgi:hypothetical protein